MKNLSLQETINRLDQLIEKAGTKHKDYREAMSNAVEVIEYLCDRLENNYYVDLDMNVVLCDAGSIPDGISTRDETIRLLDEKIKQYESSIPS